jgi:hypothetical protein
MQNLFGLLFFILLILSIVGIFKPSIVKQTNRIKGFLYPFAGAFVSLALIGLFDSSHNKLQKETNSTNTEIKSEVKKVITPEIEQVEAEVEKEWYEDGTLHKATVEDWINATTENKLATTADWLISVPKIREKLEDGSRSVDSIKPFAESIVSCVDTATKGMPKNGKIVEAGALCISGAID